MLSTNFIIDYVRGLSVEDAKKFGKDIKDYGYIDTEFLIVLAIGTKLKDGSWKVSKYIVYDGNTRLLAVQDIETVTTLPCKVIYATEGT